MSWLQERHAEYERLKERANFARLYRTGEVSGRAETQARTLERRANNRGRQPVVATTDMHLIQRKQGEPIDAYVERVMLSRYPRHFGRIVASFVGSIMQVEDDAMRQWGPEDGEGLGSPDEGVFADYWADIDGTGLNWPMAIVDVLDTLITAHGQWYLVDPPSDGRGRARLHLLRQENVVNWRREGGRLVEVVVQESVDTRSSVKDTDAEPEMRYVLYTLDGWERYRMVDGADQQIDEGEWAEPFFVTPEQEERRLPIGYTKIQLSEHVGYNTALDARYLYNLLSDIRWSIRVPSFAKLTPDEPMDEGQYELARKAIGDGNNFLTFPANYAGPNSDIYETAYNIYKEEVKDFYHTALQSYEDAAKEKTATQIRQEQGSGRYSFLSVLAAAIDEWENDVLYLIEQIERPDDSGLWRTHTVERTRDFSPIDAQERSRQLAERYFGPKSVPVGDTGRANAAKEIASIDSVEIDPAETEEAVRVDSDRRSQQAALL